MKKWLYFSTLIMAVLISVILPRAFLRTGGASRDMVERLKGPSQALYTLLRAYL